ncbi:MAG: hypothetical protein HOF52_06565, partial [Thiotrichales bacterium]|nr:hypothetical protein [Thiotrichales bacterium]
VSIFEFLNQCRHGTSVEKRDKERSPFGVLSKIIGSLFKSGEFIQAVLADG